MDTVREFRLLPAGLPDAQQKLTKRYLIPQLLILLAVMVISGVLGMRRASFGTVVVFSVFVGLFITYIAFVSPRRMRRSLKRCWDTYILTIGPDYLLRRQADAPDVKLLFTDVKKIEQVPGRYLRVIGNAKYQVIGIPESIENFEEVFSTVSRIIPPTNPKNGSQFQKHTLDGGGLCLLHGHVMGAFSKNRAAARGDGVYFAALAVRVHAEKSQRFAPCQAHLLALSSVCASLHS